MVAAACGQLILDGFCAKYAGGVGAGVGLVGCCCWRVGAGDACQIGQVSGLAHVVQQLACEVTVRVSLLPLKSDVLLLAGATFKLLHCAARWRLPLWYSEASPYPPWHSGLQR